MTIEEAIAQLKDLRKDRESFAKSDEPGEVFEQDIEAIDVALEHMDKHGTYISMNAHRKLMKENADLKRLLRLAVEDIKKVSDDNCCYHCIYGNPITRHCEEYKGNENCYKWKHAEEASELLGDDADD